MIGSKYFYHGHTRKLIAAFGSLFTNLRVYRVGGSGEPEKYVSVPIKYGPTDLAIAEEHDRKTTDDPLYEVFPRLVYSMTGISYAGEEQRQQVQRTLEASPVDASRALAAFSPAPYDFSFELLLVARNQTDALQVVEQILPYFTPDMSIKIASTPLTGFDMDVNVRLDDASMEDTYQEEGKRIVTWTFSFTCRYFLFGAVDETDFTALERFVTIVREGGTVPPEVLAAVKGSKHSKPRILYVTIDAAEMTDDDV